MVRTLLVVVLSLSLFVRASGQGWPKLSSAFPVEDFRLGDSFGYSISVDGDYALVGAPFYDADGVTDAGKAFLLRKQNGSWTIIHEIINPQPTKGCRFGETVLLKGDLAFVGAPSPLAFDVEGKVFVYSPLHESWGGPMQSRGQLFPDVSQARDRFGISIVMTGETVAVSAPGAMGTFGRRGAVYLFTGFHGESVVLFERIEPASADTYNFGTSLAANNNYLFVTAPIYDPSFQNPGAAFVYDIDNGFTQAARIDPPGNNTHNFGATSAASVDTYAVTSYTANENGTFGAVYVYSFENGWTGGQQPDCIYTPSDGAGNFLYGWSLLLSDDDRLFVGYERQRVDMYTRTNTWTQETPFVSITTPVLSDNPGIGKSVAYNGTDILIGDSRYEKPNVTSGVVFAFDAQPNPEMYGETHYGTVSAELDHFGSAVDIHGSYAIVGASDDDINGDASGRAYIFEFDGTSWHMVAKLKASDGGVMDYFGATVSITNDRAVVSAPHADYNDYRSGKVYVFEKPAGGWKDMVETAVITRVNDERGEFGHQVDVHDNEIVITQMVTNQSFGVGYAYVFRKEGNEWIQKAELHPTERTDEYAALFGYSLAFDGATVAIGSPWAASARGAVFVFAKPDDGWQSVHTEDAVLTTSDSYFSTGRSVDVNGDVIISGGINSKQNGTEGAAYIFEKGEKWLSTKETAKLVSNPNTNTKMGYDVCITDDYALVSGTSHLVDISCVYLFKKSNGKWMNSAPYAEELIDGKPGPSNLKIAVSDEQLIVGAEMSDGKNGRECGMVEFRIKSPTVRNVTTTAPDGKYKAGDVIDIQVVFSQRVYLDGAPTGLNLVMHDNTTRTASYTGFTDNLALNFRYVVAESDSTPRLNYVDERSLLGDFTPRKLDKGWIGFKELPHPTSKASLAGGHALLIDGDYTEPIPVSIDDELDALSIYPVPFDNGFRINGDVTRVVMVDVTGRHVYDSIPADDRVSIVNIPSGIYFVQLYLGTKVKTVRALKL